MLLNRSLVDADDSVDVLYGVLCALMLALPEAVRETFPELQMCCKIMGTVTSRHYTRCV